RGSCSDHPDYWSQECHRGGRCGPEGLSLPHRLDEAGAEIEEIRPFSRVLGGRRLPVGAVDKGVRAIPEQPTFRNLSGVQFLSHHGLDGIAPKRNHRTRLDLRRVWHTSLSLACSTRDSSLKPGPRFLRGLVIVAAVR